MSVQPSYRPFVEPLENRELLTTGIQAYVSGLTLYVMGTAGNDIINVTESNNQIAVPGSGIAVNGKNVNSVNASAVSQVIVYGNGGNNSVDLSTLKTAATIYCGSGANTVVCGTDSDTVNSGGGSDLVYRPFVPTEPISNGTAITDIHQGQNPLCQTDAALAEAVNDGFNFNSVIHYQGNDIYDVTLGGKTPMQKVFFNGWSNDNDPVMEKGAFWTVLMQRARLQSLGINTSVEQTTANWNAINQKDGGELYSISDALYCFTGSIPTYSTMNAVNPQALQSDLAKGDYLVAQSHNNNVYVSSDGIIGNHAYAVLSVYNSNGAWLVRLYNPWGMDRENGATIDSLDKSHPAANDGIITLTWQQFTNSANFAGLYVGKK